MTWMVMDEEDIAYLISFELGKVKYVEVCDAFSIVDQHQCVLINETDFLQYKEHYDYDSRYTCIIFVAIDIFSSYPLYAQRIGKRM